MHIAVCDDHIADRKQMERLLQRSSDKRIHTTGVFYIDSYGNVDAVFRSPMLYDVFYIDMTDGSVNGYELACKLIASGISAPIVLCCSSIDYRQLAASEQDQELAVHLQSQLRYLDKPIRVSDLEESLEEALALKEKTIPTIELRGDVHTLYVHEEEILYLQKSGKYVHVSLTESRDIDILSSMDNMYAQLESFVHFLPISEKLILNVLSIRKLSLLQVTMQDGRSFSLSPFAHHTLKTALAYLHSDTTD